MIGFHGPEMNGLSYLLTRAQLLILQVKMDQQRTINALPSHRPTLHRLFKPRVNPSLKMGYRNV